MTAVAVNYGNVLAAGPTLRLDNDDKAAANAAVCPRCDIKKQVKRAFILDFDIATVSYTHLDVYKRQVEVSETPKTSAVYEPEGE